MSPRSTRRPAKRGAARRRRPAMEPPIGGPRYGDATPEEVDALRRTLQARVEGSGPDPYEEFANPLVEIIGMLPEPWKTAAQAVVDDPFPRMHHRHHPVLFIAQAYCDWFFAVYWNRRRLVSSLDGRDLAWSRCSGSVRIARS